MTTPAPEQLAARFEAHRTHVQAVAYRVLGSVSEAEDAVQETWIRFSRADVAGIDNLRAWLTTVVARVSLDLLRARTSRREDALDAHVPDPIVRAIGSEVGPEEHAILADSVGLALLVVLEHLEPAERLAFVLHDVFGMSFEEIAPIVERSIAATRQLASRARRRMRGRVATADADLRSQRRVVDAFLAAVASGDLQALMAVLDPEMVLRADGGSAKGFSRVVRGAQAVAEQAITFANLGLTSQVVLVNGRVGVVSRLPNGRVLSVTEFTVARGRIVEMNILADAQRLDRIQLPEPDSSRAGGP